ncbi:MAG: hypothetical protein A2X88_09550 [Deltaproteobacteria bacterium GWC2_65_14]|nr:MAG: hypothetical protein A2X88_09550 [Deltaproteobacteria bacterium GWC2_65_14]
MDCGDAKELLSACLDGEASAGDSRRVEEHLAGCAGCKAGERRMRALDVAIARTGTDVSPDFRERLFSRMEAEELLPKRRSLFAFSFRWAALPLAAAALGLFFLMSREAPRGPAAPGSAPQVAVIQPESPARAARETRAPEGTAVAGREELAAEEREIVAYLEILEDPASFEEPGGIDEMEMFLPDGKKQG